MKRRALVLVALLLASCGGGSPAAPTQVASAQVAGTWAVQTSLTSVSGDSQTAATCVLGNLRAILPASSAILQLTQSGANLNATSQDTLPNGGGAVTTYTGTALAQTILLNYKNCDLCVAHGVTCPTGVVDITQQDGSIQANLTGSTLTGSESITYSIGGVGIAKAAMFFTATRQ